MRWAIAIAVLGLAAAPADAQVFKPKAKAPAAEKKPARPAAKKKAAPKKKAVSAKKKAAAADEAPAPKDDDTDFVKITDDDEIE
jgi:hypothetical protein